MKQASPGPISDINVTPLVDVCLVLVIIFMVISPFAMQAGIEPLSEVLSTRRNKKALATAPVNTSVNPNR